MQNTPAKSFDGPNGALAYHQVDGKGPTVVWLGGFKSDMTGTKAAYLDQWARARARGYLRFDYSGHGESDGNFEQGCISDWAADAAAIISAKTTGRLILVGSSMGAWITTLIARQLHARLAGLVLIAPALDFTEALMWPGMSEADRQTILRDGRLETPSEYSDEPTVITQKLIEDGRNNLVLDQPLDLQIPIRVLQGMNDPDVPFAHALKCTEAFTSDDILFAISKSGDHRLSTPEDLSRLIAAIEAI